MTGEAHPIVRMWGGHVPTELAAEFHQHLLATGVAEARDIDGFFGATVLRRAHGDRVHITLLTTWADDAALRRFAGADTGTETGTARLYPGDERFGLVPDPHATHHELVCQVGDAGVRHAYLTAAGSAANLLTAPELAEAWERPSALEHYSVAGLAGHLAGQIFFAERALAEPVGTADPIDILTYYDRVSWRHADHGDAVHVRIREGSAHLSAAGPAALAARAADAVRWLPVVLAAEPADRLIHLPTWDWTLRFDDFLLSRTVELMVHTDDLAVSIGVPTPEPSATVTDAVLTMLTRLPAQRHGATAVLRALTRAERSPTTIAAL